MSSLLFTRQGIFSFFVSLGTILLLMLFYFTQNCSLTAEVLSELPGQPEAVAVKKKVESAAGKPAQTAEHITFLEDYAAAVEESKKQRKPLLLYFFICDKNVSDKNTKADLTPVFSNAEVKMLSGQFVCAALETCQNSALCKTLAVNKYPSVLLFDASGTEINRLSGKQVEQELAVSMHVVIQASVAKASATLR